MHGDITTLIRPSTPTPHNKQTVQERLDDRDLLAELLLLAKDGSDREQEGGRHVLNINNPQPCRQQRPPREAKEGWWGGRAQRRLCFALVSVCVRLNACKIYKITRMRRGVRHE